MTTALEGKNVLLVDDDRDMLDALVTVLKDTGATLKTAADGNTAVELARDFDPDLVVLDAVVLAQLGFTDLAEIILAIVAGITLLPEGGLPLPEFHAGGIVPGLVGAPLIGRLHGGEAVLTQEDFGDLIRKLKGGGRSVIVNVYPREINIHGDVRESLAKLGASWAVEALN